MIDAADRAGLERELTMLKSNDPAEAAVLQAGLALLGRDAEAAIKNAETAIALRGDFAAAYRIRGRALQSMGQHKEAVADFERALSFVATDAELLAEQAQAYLALGEAADARDCFHLALALAPDFVAARVGLARLMQEAGELDAALEHIRSAARLAPLDAGIHFESARIHGQCDEIEGAVGAYERGLECSPDDAAACANFGLLLLSRIGDPRRAQQYFERAIKLDPGGVEAQANLGLALQEQGQVSAAIAHYEKLIAAYPGENEYRWNRGLALLASGDYLRGWPDYEMRNARGRGAAPRNFPFPQWNGEKLATGAGLLIYGEQGLGDEVMFASCIPDLLVRQPDCLIECEPRLAGLFARSFPAAKVHGAMRDGDRRWLAEFPHIQAQCAIGSLPRLLRKSLADFPRHQGYLVADAQRVARWRTPLVNKAGNLNVGIAWRGGTRRTRGDLRSIPLGELAAIVRMPGITFINLQRNGGPELAEFALPFGAPVINCDEALADVDKMAALLRALNAVITVDNSVAHLSGALGVSTHLLLCHSADWRWSRGGTAAPWYPAVSLHRQQTPGDWKSALAQVTAALQRE
ncbi:MAG: hypothetical protein JWN94_312 [Betaproteobacteria bacterium]|nr:hypothetical protein [Betaproteobacteria bacterium]